MTWPSDNTYYTALVLDFISDKNQHKILYLSDESIETLELGHGPGQREFHDAEPPADHLVGKDVVLNDRESDADVEWFHFMRPDHESPGDKFVVLVVSALPTDVVDFEEVSGPRKANGEHRYYRVIYLPNEYLATIDLAATDYNVVTRDTAESDERKDEEEYKPPENVDVADDHSDAPTIEPEQDTSPEELFTTDRKAVAADPDLGPDIDDIDIDIDKVAKVVSADRVLDGEKEPSTDVRVTADDAVDSLSLDQADVGIRGMGEGSVGTQETRDDSLDPLKVEKKRVPPPKPSALYPKSFEDEEDNLLSSDEYKDAWEGTTGNGGSTKVGDYIQLHTGMGVPRKAFVEAYLPQTGTHFVAFCDSRGGNLQIKLTNENHTVLGDDEVDTLNRVKKEEPQDPVISIPEDDVPKKRKRRARSPAKTRTKTKARKRDPGAQEVKSRSADEKICGRCISIIWPVENLVYVALVLGYSSHSKEHQIVYMVDHCVETLDLRYREWSLLPREKEPWISTGMVGKRLYVFWDGSYDDEESQAIAADKFGERTKVPYEAYVLSYIGDGRYKIIYTATEDTETRELRVDEEEKDLSPLEKEWDLLEDGVRHIDGLPLIGWTD